MFTFPTTFFGAGVANLTFLQAETPINASQTTYTFTNANIGTASADRYVVVVIGCAILVSGRTLNSVTIGGNAAAIHTNAASVVPVSSTSITGIAGLLVPSGTTATIAATFSGNMTVCHCKVYTLTGANSNTPTATKATTPNATGTSVNDSINITSGGALLVGATGVTSTGSFSFTGATLDSTQTTNNIPGASASIDGLGAQTPRAYSATASANNPNISMAAAVWS